MIFLLAIAMIATIGIEPHRLGGGDCDAWMANISLEKFHALQRCAIGAIFLLFVGIVMWGIK